MLCFGLFFLMLIGVLSGRADQEMKVGLKTLLPVVEGMEPTESPVTYFPETLFEYINGAAEIYISYDFRELIVAEYKKNDASDSLAVEIYDMGNLKNSFGIYSAERYPDNEFLSLGTQGYQEEGTLNFLIGRYYVKLLCFDCQDRSEEWLRAFSGEIVARVEDRGGFPDILDVFPREGLVPNTPDTTPSDDNNPVIMQKPDKGIRLNLGGNDGNHQVEETALSINSHDAVSGFCIAGIGKVCLGFSLGDITVDDGLKITLLVDVLMEC